MYHKRIFFTIVITFVLIIGLGINGNGVNPNSINATADQIYQSIRNSQSDIGFTESVVTYKNEGMNIVATLCIPKTHKLCPIVITLNGFIGSRNEANVPGTTEGIFQRTSRILASHGIASLRVDYRGYQTYGGESDGTFEMMSFSTQISDVRASIDYICDSLKHRVDTKSIGIIGFSQGGLVGTCTAARDERVKSLVLWSAVAAPALAYENLFTKDGMKRGLVLPAGGSITTGLYLEGQYLFDVTMGYNFFQDIFNIDPVAEIRNFKGSLLSIAGKGDVIVWPQPKQSEAFLKYHNGIHKEVVLDADHAFNYWDGPNPPRLDDAIYWSAAWFLSTLR